MDKILSNLRSSEFRYATLEGRSHLVVPVVLLTEGVHNGSAGPLYYPKEEIQRFAHAWNGMPVPVYHPEENGIPCSCNQPETLERYNVGRLFSVQFTDNKLKGEIWVDVQKANQVHPGLIEMLKDPQAKLEVSTGLTSNHEEIQGTWNNENYSAIVRDIHPDHLALLPGTKGACSWEDGCGIRVNKEKDMKKHHPILDNEASLDEKLDLLRRKVDMLDNDMYWHFLESAHDDYLVYRKSNRSNEGEQDQLYKVGYSINDNNEVEFIGDPVKVKKEVSYTTINKEDTMSKKKEDKDVKDTQNKKADCPNCKELVDSLISNEHTAWNEDDRAFLEEMDQSSLEKMVPVIPEPAAEPTVNENNEEEEEQPMTVNDYIANAPSELQEMMREGMRSLKEKKDSLIGQITSNKRNTFTKEQLEGKSTDELQAIANLAVTPKYEGNPARVTDNQDQHEELLELPSLNFEKK